MGKLLTLYEEALACQRCNLRAHAQRVVFGEGNENALLMLVGEGPGAEEDRQGRPFVGAAGELLNKILEAAGISREEVYIGNVVKCRPPNNRVPTKDEVAACRQFLDRQIELIKPKIIVCLGATAAQALIGPEVRITKIRGLWHEKGDIKIMPTYHPAALLRDPAKKRPTWEDFKAVRDLYFALKQNKEIEDFEQLQLF
ncbi:uracil-DNA glycosylase [Carboxydothermus pertinax]|uniref:Type-4 uracil-DNA glycosylase n=1 Tax=Carboxydothermus pertinax TaxID=870242 RepID=A0A1L8CVD4_9THEO|nr:uracil-DNA glycosylase [Carboxydothermus pertinax]GAV22809.1 DNA polymerase [Carboxydothermus pertinax]